MKLVKTLIAIAAIGVGSQAFGEAYPGLEVVISENGTTLPLVLAENASVSEIMLLLVSLFIFWYFLIRPLKSPAEVKQDFADERKRRITLAKTSLRLNLNWPGLAIHDLTPVSDLTNLEWADFKLNEISDLTPLAGLKNLEFLDLGGNWDITDIMPLKGLTNLETLSLSNNYRITDFTPLACLKKLESLDLGGSEIPEDQKKMLKKSLPNCKIKY